MSKQQQKGKRRKLGRNAEKCKGYQADKSREKAKLKRVLQSNGLAAAKEYAARYGLDAFLRRLPRYLKLAEPEGL